MRRRALGQGDMVALVVLMVAVPLHFAPVWATGRVFTSDGQFAAFFAPISTWSDAWIGGWPVAADPVSYVFYPVRILFRLWGSFNGFVIAAYVIAAAGLYAYLRTLGVTIGAALLGAFSFAFSGFMLGHTQHTTMVHTAAWLTPALAGVEATLARGHRRWALLAAVAVGLLCSAGHTQFMMYGLLQLGLYLAWRLAWARRHDRLRAWGVAVAALALGIALAAPALLMTAAYLPETPRKTLTYERFVTTSAALPVEQLPGLFFPFLFGAGADPYQSSYFGKWSFGEVCTHMPFIVLLLAAAGISTGPMRIGLYWTAIGVAAALLTLGDAIPWLATIVYGIPGLNLFRAQGRHAFEVCLALAVLAAFGFDALLRGVRARSWLAPVTIVTLTFAFALVWVVRRYPRIVNMATLLQLAMPTLAVPPWDRNPALWIPVALAVLALGAFALAAGNVARRWKMLAVLGMLTLEHACFGWFMPWVRSAPPLAKFEPALMEELVMQEMRASPGRVLNVKGRIGSRFTLTPERSRLFGLSSANWYGPLVPERAAAMLDMAPSGQVTGRVGDPANVVLDVYGVRYIVVEPSGPSYHWALTDEARWRLIASGDGVSAYENLRARPLAWLVGTWEQMPDADALETLRRTNEDEVPFDAAGTAVVADLESGRIEGFDHGEVQSRWVGAEALEIETHSRSGGLLVISVNHLPGWEAAIDGAPVDVHRADYALVAVRVPAGRHVVRLCYVAPGWGVGLLVSLVGVGGFATVCRLARQGVRGAPPVDGDQERV